MMSRVSTALPAPSPKPVSCAPIPVSADLDAALIEAQHVAGAGGRDLSTLDVLIAMLRVGGSAARLLAERGVSPTQLEAISGDVQLDRGPGPHDLIEACREIAGGLAATQIGSLHLLLAILRSDGAAVQALRLSSVDPGKLRGIVMRRLTAPTEAHERSRARLGSDGPSPKTSKPSSGREGAVDDERGVRVDDRTSGDVLQVSTGRADSRESANSTGWGLCPVAPPHAPVLHREREVGRLLDLLQAKTARIVAIVGEPGSGRSALLAALSAVSLQPPLFPSGDMGAPPSPGALLHALHRQASPTSPIVLDGSAWLGPDGGDGPLALLATAAAGRRWIVCLTPGDMRRIESASPDLFNQMESVCLVSPEAPALHDMVAAGIDSLSAATPIEFAGDVAATLVRLASRYPSERAQPGRSLAIAEIAAARAERLGLSQVGVADIAAVVADAAGVPAKQLLRDDHERFSTLEERLATRVVGHAEARAKIASVLRRSFAGFRGRRPLASLLLLGPTGTGKTETARAIADALFDGESALVRIDLSEYSESHAVARLIGSPPGYLGHEDGGQLTEALRRRPACVVLFDEMEKASREVLLALLQVLEDGRLTDGRGRTVDFSSAAVVMTSNLGSECYRRTRAPTTATIMALARSRLPPELWNRIDEVLCYAPLSDVELGLVVKRLARDSSDRLFQERGIAFDIDDSVVTRVLDIEPDRSLGARPLRRAFERLIEGPLANEIVAGRLARGTRLKIAFGNTGKLDLRSLLP
jgi:ATP-dependent Clp protease ATP-binding subunit ClpC